MYEYIMYCEYIVYRSSVDPQHALNVVVIIIYIYTHIISLPQG